MISSSSLRLLAQKRRPFSLTAVLAFGLLAATVAQAADGRPAVIPAPPPGPHAKISKAEMEHVYNEVKTPFKYGIVINREEHESVDCPNVFRYGDKWYMVFVSIKNTVGYQTCLAESDDLLHWKRLGKILPFSGKGWDQWQADGSIGLVNPDWNGDFRIQPFDGKYWISYFGGSKKGYESDPLSLGIAWTTDPAKVEPWHRLSENPVLSPSQSDARQFEQATIYKSYILWDKSETLGYPFVMYYNAKQKGPWLERIGMAVSKDMVHWIRYGKNPVIQNMNHKNHKGISGDPQIVHMGDLWVMFYFGAGWGDAAAFDTFAVSRDLVHWTKWTGPDIMSPSKPYDKIFAHKPWIIKHDGIVYHFYCGVSKTSGRVICLATSKDLRATDDAK